MSVTLIKTIFSEREKELPFKISCNQEKEVSIKPEVNEYKEEY